jgi:hypothetical protein
LISLVIGVAVLAGAIWAGETLSHALGGGNLARVLGQSLHIGGWVALWEPMQIFLYEWWPILSDIRLYEQLSTMPVKIVYTASSPTSTQSSKRNIDLVPVPKDSDGLGANHRNL